MKTVDKLYAIVEIDDEGNEKFFNGLHKSGSYNKSYKLSVYRYEKSAINRLAGILYDYQNFIDGDDRYYRTYRFIGELVIKEFTA